MIAKKLKKEIKPIYAEMLDILKEAKNPEYIQDSCVFCAQWGKNYHNLNHQHRILVVGRAVNGWKNNCLEADNLFDGMYKEDGSELPENRKIFNLDDQMVWVEAHAGKRQNEGKKNYNSNKSAFWRVNKRIVQEFLPKETYNGVNWLDNFAWSNLYKIAPFKIGANPSPKLSKLQRNHCIKILRKEIKIFNPKYIVMLTGFWEPPFLKNFLGLQDKDELESPVDKILWDHPKGYSSKLYKIDIEGQKRVIIATPHPMGKKEKPHAEAILKIMKSN